MNSHIVIAVGVGHATGETHDLSNLMITKGRASAIGVEKLAERFGARNTKHVAGSPSNVDYCEYSPGRPLFDLFSNELVMTWFFVLNCVGIVVRALLAC